MELRRILMGLYLLAFPAMMWGQTPVVPGTADEEHSGHHKETPVNFGFKGGFTSSLFLVSQFSVNGIRATSRGVPWNESVNAIYDQTQNFIDEVNEKNSAE